VTAPRTLPGDPAGPLRRLALLVVLVGAAGLLLELLLIEHWEPGWQLAPLVLLVAVFALAAAVLRRPTARLVRLFGLALVACAAAGLLGVWLHLAGNLEFEREMDPTLGGRALLWESVRGATPLLAPGAMLQLGLVGLLFAYRHPALRRPAADADRSPP